MKEKISPARIEFLKQAREARGVHAVEEYPPAKWAIAQKLVTVVEGRFGSRVHHITPEGEEAHKRAVARWERWEDPRPLMQAGADRNMARYAEHDGLRLVAWLARHVPEGGDPLKTLIQLAVDAGWDVPPEDIAWAEGDAREEEPE